MASTPVRFAQRKARRASAHRVGRQWRHYGQMIGAAGLFIGVIALLPDFGFNQIVIGFALGATTLLVTLAASGFDDPVERGDEAELWTRDTFKKIGWPIVNTLQFDYFDLDHVLVTPSGLLAVETKYRFRNSDLRTVTKQRHRDLDAARRGAHKLSLLLRSTACRHEAHVAPVLIVWGPGGPDLRDGYKIVDDVYVLDGAHPSLWAHLFKAPLLTQNVRDALVKDLVAFQAKQLASATGEPSRRHELITEFRAGTREAGIERRYRAERRKSLRHRHGNRTPSATAIGSDVA